MEGLLERHKNLNRGFRKLDVWQDAVELYVFLKKNMADQKGISFKIRDQVLDATFSVSSNIAEGHCRRSIKEYIQFINVALGSCGEIYSQFYALLRSGDLSQNIFDEFDKRHYSMENKLLGMAKALSQKLKDKGEWEMDYKTSARKLTPPDMKK